MKNSIKHILLFAALAAVSCENWLDVTPPSEIRDEDHYSTAEGFQQTLLGCYIAMTKADLYGENLTWHMTDMLGRQYDARKNSAADDYALDRYNYAAAKSVAVIERIWEKSYSVITNANEALIYIDRNKERLDSVNYRMIKGELLAVRAYLHFDLMRLFGCSNLAGRSDLESRHTIPYSTAVEKDAAPQLTYAETIRNLVTDLTEAARLLEIDPVRSKYPADLFAEANIDGFYDYREQHLNYYAVKALLARAYWTMNDLEKAEGYAQEVIDSGKFPLKTTAGAWNSLETGTLDMQETVVGLYSTTFTYYYYFDLIRSSTSMGSMKLAEQYTSIFEADQEGNADRRYVAWFDRNNNWCTKHYNVMYASSNDSGSTATYNGNSIPGVSLIRIPEMYYIVAEANLTKDPDKATEYLDYVVTSRDQTAFADREAGKITEENIFNDRRKEFFADGDDFHNMKRLARDLTISGMGTFAGNDDATYTMPIPASVEDNYRQ